MNKNELANILKEYGIKDFSNKDYYIKLALKFTDSYLKFFTEQTILNILDFSSVIEFSRLPFNKTFSKDEINSISFQDITTFYLDGKPSFEMDSKKNVINIWRKGEKVRLNSVVDVLSYINSLYEKDCNSLMLKLEEYQKHRIFLSNFYQYVLCLLEEKAVSDIDSARIGLFKNAYFDILNYVLFEFNELKR